MAIQKLLATRTRAKQSKEVSAVLTLMDLTIPVLFYNYLGEIQDELINLTLVSKKIKKICKMSGIEWKIIPTIIISPHQDGIISSIAQYFSSTSKE
jgi:hypothetical protein